MAEAQDGLVGSEETPYAPPEAEAGEQGPGDASRKPFRKGLVVGCGAAVVGAIVVGGVAFGVAWTSLNSDLAEHQPRVTLVAQEFMQCVSAGDSECIDRLSTFTPSEVEKAASSSVVLGSNYGSRVSAEVEEGSWKIRAHRDADGPKTIIALRFVAEYEFASDVPETVVVVVTDASYRVSEFYVHQPPMGR